MRVPSSTCRPPTTITIAVPASVIAVTHTENIDSCQVRRRRAFIVSLADAIEALQLVTLPREALDRHDRRQDLEGAIRSAWTSCSFTRSARWVIVRE